MSASGNNSGNFPRNSVEHLMNIKFHRLPLEQKKHIKQLGRPMPNLSNLVQTVSCSKRNYTRQFSTDFYKKWNWLCGCDIRGALFCFPCLLFDGDIFWTRTGFKDLNHLSDRCKKHEATRKHIGSCLKFAFLGPNDIRDTIETNDTHKKNIVEHNLKVQQNRQVLNTIINALRFCGVFELENKESSNPGIFRGLLEYTAELDSTLKTHLLKTTGFRGTSKIIQNELLQTMLEICQMKIKEEIDAAKYVAIIADDTTDVCNSSRQVAVVLRYIVKDAPVERFWTLLNTPQQNADSLSSCILKELENLNINETPDKLIAQTYDGASVMSSSSNGVHKMIKSHYPKAEFVHCHAHQLYLVLMQGSSINPSVKVFFASFQGICAFFSTSPQRTALLNNIIRNDIVRTRLCHSVPGRWNFQSRSISELFEYKTDIEECMRVILSSSTIHNTSILNQAAGYLEILENSSFSFWLGLFAKIMPVVEILSYQLQKVDIDSSIVNQCVSNFGENIVQIRNEITMESDDEDEPSVKRSKDEQSDLKRQAKEVCDVIICQVKERFNFTGYLVSRALFISKKFPSYDGKFPEGRLKKVCSLYPSLSFEKLKAELSVIYSNFSGMSGAPALYKFLKNNDLEETFSQTMTLLEILITTPMTKCATETYSLKRIKTFLENSMSGESLCALAMLSIEKRLVSEIPDFNQRVIEKFAQQKQRRLDFNFK